MKRKLGDCYKVNADYLINIWVSDKNDLRLRDVFLCHGRVIGAKGSVVEGQEFDHCWIEVGNDVIMDFSNKKTIIGRLSVVEHRIIRSSVKKYTAEQVAKNILEYEHYGGWDL